MTVVTERRLGHILIYQSCHIEPKAEMVHLIRSPSHTTVQLTLRILNLSYSIRLCAVFPQAERDNLFFPERGGQH